jgi:tetratricopeptide (TPR) repeat protein
MLGLSLAQAQQRGRSEEDEQVQLTRKASASSSAMYEDIEILRRLLHDKIQAVYPAAQGITYPEPPMLNRRSNGQTQGPYLEPAWPQMPGKRQRMDPSTGVPMTFADLNANVAWDAQAWQLQNLADSAGASPNWLNTRNVSGESRPRIPFPEGVYLEGQGVVYTVTLPPAPPAPQGTAKPPARPLTDWDRVRKEMRGEKVEAPQRQAARRPTLTEVILRALADNGHHFSQLPQDESITVVITFRPAQNIDGGPLAVFGQRAGSSQGGPPSGPANPRGNQNGPQTRNPADPMSGGQSMAAAMRDALKGSSAGESAPESARDYELLGDLHSKVGRYEEALRAYRNAVAKDNDRQHLASLYLKMAALHLSGPKDEDAARKAVERGLRFLAQTQAKNTATQTGSAGGFTAAATPSKLIISVPKRLCDQVATGRIDFEAFRKAARVRHIPLPAAGQKPATPGAP